MEDGAVVAHVVHVEILRQILDVLRRHPELFSTYPRLAIDKRQERRPRTADLPLEKVYIVCIVELDQFLFCCGSWVVH